MNVLTSKGSKNPNYISRYTNFPFYYHSLDHKYIQGLTAQLYTGTDYVLEKVTESTTLDALSNKYYGRPDYWWLIADFNRIQDPFVDLYSRFSSLKIPSISSASFIEDIHR